MKFRLFLVAGLLAPALAFAQVVPMTGAGAGAPSGGYSPPLDAIGQANVARAYSTCRMFTAYNSTLVQTIRFSDTDTKTWPALATGCVDWTAIAAECASATACKAVLYDQSGNAVNTTQGNTGADAAHSVLIDPANKWINFNNNPASNDNSFHFTDYAQPSDPFAYVVNYNWQGQSGTESDVLYTANTGNGIGTNGVNNQIFISFGTSLVLSPITNAYWHTVTFVANSPSGGSVACSAGDAQCAGGSISGNTGAGLTTAATAWIGGYNDNNGFSFNGYTDTFIEFKGNPAGISTFVTNLRASGVHL